MSVEANLAISVGINIIDTRSVGIGSDLSCTEVRGAWKYILFAFMLLNMIAFIVSALYLMMLCCPRGGLKHRGHRGPPHENGNGGGLHAATYAPVRSAL